MIAAGLADRLYGLRPNGLRSGRCAGREAGRTRSPLRIRLRRRRLLHARQCARHRRGYLEGRELATDFRHPESGAPYNPHFAAMARSAGAEVCELPGLGQIRPGIRTRFIPD
jgi:hypothetical protein